MSKKTIVEVISHSLLKLLAGKRAFYRGEEYFQKGLVESLSVDQDHASATVRGSLTYHCQLKTSGESIQGECTCPAFEESKFCKHMVAVGLSIIQAKGEKDKDFDIRDEIRPHQRNSNRYSKETRRASVSIEEVREYVSNLSREKLVETLITQAMNDFTLLKTLRLEVLSNRATNAQNEQPKSPQEVIDTIKDAIDQAVHIGGGDSLLEWSDEYETARALKEIVKKIRSLLDSEMVAEVIGLSEYCLAAVDPIIERFHEGGQLVEILDDLQEIHLSACKKTPPAPKELARRLLYWEMTSGWGVFDHAPVKYKTILGEQGLETYKALATAEWAKLPPRQERSYDRDSIKRHRITRIMETLARLSGDVEAEAAIHIENISGCYDYLKIAELYASRQFMDRAIEWAEKGLKIYSQQPDRRLREFLAKEYHRLSRHDEAMALIWASFCEHPSLENFKCLKAHADINQSWQHWRTKGIEHLTTKGTASVPNLPGTQLWSSTLVELYLWENDVDTAWKQARAGGAACRLWHQLAVSYEKTHPALAVEAYKILVDDEVCSGGNDSYRAAVKLVETIQFLMIAANLDDQFLVYLQEIRRTYKTKKNFIRLLDASFGG